MKIIAKVKELPNLVEVTKVTGTKRYQLNSKLNIFCEGNPDVKIEVGENVYFLIPLNMSLNGIMAVTGDFEVAWEVSDDELHRWIDQRIYMT